MANNSQKRGADTNANSDVQHDQVDLHTAPEVTAESRHLAALSTGFSSRVNLVMENSDERAIIERLEKCDNLPDFFETIKDEINALIDSPRFRVLAESFEEYGENVIQAIKVSDFEPLAMIYKDRLDLYLAALELGTIKNEMIKEITEKALEVHGERLGVSPAEKTLIVGLLKTTTPIDKAYLDWNKKLYPDSLMKRFKNRGGKFEKFLTENGLDDPYAVVHEESEGVYKSIPYAIAFKENVDAHAAELQNLIDTLRQHQDKDFGGGLDKQKMIAYLKAYKAALLCDESVKDNGEWKSVNMWKEVDKLWLQLKGRIQLVHQIESGYATFIDPAKIKVMPDIRIMVQNTTLEEDKMMGEMSRENAVSMREIAGEVLSKRQMKRLEPSLIAMSKSDASIAATIAGAGDALRLMGAGQGGVRYDDVQDSYGAKSYCFSRETFEREELNAVVSKKIFGDSMDFLEYEASKGQYIIQSLGGHEVGHVFMGTVKDLEEVKSSWVAIVGLKQRNIPPRVMNEMMVGHARTCLRYLDIPDKSDDYAVEGIVNVKIFLRTGLIAKSPDGKWVFNYEKIDETYDAIRAEFLKLIQYHMTPKLASEYKEWRKSLADASGEFAAELKELSDLAVQGEKEYLENVK